jgi:ribosome biogenesis GTPase A
MVKNYSSNKVFITTSMLPLTTLDVMEVEINDKLTIIDTPGFIEEGNIVNSYDYATLKKVLPKNEIRPRTYQVSPDHSLTIDNYVQIDYKEGPKNSFTFYISNDLNISYLNLVNNIKVPKYQKRSFDINGEEDIVISGLGWIKITGEGIIDIFVNEKVNIYKRNSII